MTESKHLLRRAHCAECGGIRNCDIRGHHQKSGEDADGYYQYWIDIYILQCRGCDSLFVQKIESNSEDVNQYYDHDGSTVSELIESITYWPSISNRLKPTWFPELQFEIEGAQTLFESMNEMYGALDAGLPRLAVIGIRTSFDVASAMLSVPENLSFENKIKQLVNIGKLTNVDQARLTVLVDAGNASAHRGWNPKPDDLKLLAEILEHFVENVFILPLRTSRLDAQAAKLKPKVPPRPKKSK
ncbi:MAG: DUF4145 domain-containing protein [Beijerinckiaceae bacterium]|nr:DUF4145 domain-containing protein [Beijerinckiaceae bacterium]